MTALSRFRAIQNDRHQGRRIGIMSVCSAHPIVLEAAMHSAQTWGCEVLIEATCNQVNQFGGYTGMQPADFRQMVLDIAKAVGLPKGRILLGGDHLGPNPWRHLSAAEAMQNATQMVADYVKAGFEKIHIDCTMTCNNDTVPLNEATIAQRTAALCRTAEAAGKKGGIVPVYVIGSEVPPPGGAADTASPIEITKPYAVRETVRLHREAFVASGIDDALDRVVAIVVQPGVEFSNNAVHHYRSSSARELSLLLNDYPTLMFEAHSTDFQRSENLVALVQDGFCILKVGPWLTYVLREALYDLNDLYQRIDPQAPDLRAIVEQAMLDNPKHWDTHYHGSDEERAWLRHNSYSDRIRYYWSSPEVEDAVSTLINKLDLIDRKTIINTCANMDLNITLPDEFDSIKTVIICHISQTINKYCIAVGA